jgi:hypothetical protein
MLVMPTGADPEVDSAAAAVEALPAGLRCCIVPARTARRLSRTASSVPSRAGTP